MLRRRLMMAYQKSRLPDMFQEVEYIQSTGKQYIDTGFKASSKTKVEVMINTKGDATGFIFGARESKDSVEQLVFWQGEENRNVARIGNMAGGLDILLNFDEKKRLIIVSKDMFCVNDIKVKLSITNEFKSNLNQYLFSLNINGKNDFVIHAKLYYCKIYDNDVVMRDFVPCYEKLNGKVGLYDLVENKFYRNVGMGEFLKGDDV